MARPDLLQILRDDYRAGTLPLLHAKKPVYLHAAPGRLDVLGALGATAGGTLAQMPLPLRAAVALQPCEKPIFRIHSDRMELQPLAEVHLEKMYESETGVGATGKVVDERRFVPLLAQAPPWTARMLALYFHFTEIYGGTSTSAGLKMVIRSDLPLAAGQGSSTAILSAMLLALCDMCQVKMDLIAQSVCIQRAETLAALAFAGDVGQNHVIDAMTCLESAQAPPPLTPSLFRFTAQPHRLVGAVPLPPEVRILALNLGIKAAHSARRHEELAELRLAGAMGFRIVETIYKDLGQRHTPLHGYLANTSPLLYRQYFRSLLPKRMRGSDFLRTYGTLRTGPGYFHGISEESLDPAALYRVRTAVDHLIAENEHAEQFLQAMEELTDAEGLSMEPQERQRTLQRAGRLLLASHHSYRLRIELSFPQADWLVDNLMEAGVDRGIYGARITGSGSAGGGGTRGESTGGTVAALLARSSEANDALLDIMKAFTRTTGLTLSITEAGTR